MTNKIHIGMAYKNKHTHIFSTQLLNDSGLAIADYSIIQENAIPKLFTSPALSIQEVENFVNESRKLYQEFIDKPIESCY